VVFCVLYGLVLLVLPIRHIRYAWPLYPAFIFGLLNGVRLLAARFTTNWAPAVFGFAALLALMGAARVLAEPKPVNLYDLPEVREVSDFVRAANTLEPVRVTFFKPRSFAWATGIPAMGPIRGSSDCMFFELKRKRITHVIAGAVRVRRRPGHGQLGELAAARPDLFAPLFENRRFRIYRFHAPADPVGEAPPVCGRRRQ
jgi:hypothetical protein